MNRYKAHYLLLLLCTLFVSGMVTKSYSQEPVGEVTIAKRYTLHSSVLNEERSIIVYTPVGYDLSTSNYPVVYFLDGNSHIKHLGGMVDDFIRNQKFPPMILVGIVNTNRTRDLTPPGSNVEERHPEGGKAANFLSFIKTELIPFIDGHWRTMDYRVLIGHSYGGLFTAYSFIEETDLFAGYIAISPSLFWDNTSYISKTETLLKERVDLSSIFYLTIGNEDEGMVDSPFDQYVAVMEKNKPEKMTFLHNKFPDENHNTIPHISMLNGLTAIFSEWTPPANARELTLDELKEHFENVSGKIGVAIDIPEFVINQAAYFNLNRDQKDKSESFFLYNIEKYPHSPNVYDSYGDWLMTYGEKEEVVKYYTKAVEMAKKIDHPYYPTYVQKLERLKQELEL